MLKLNKVVVLLALLGFMGAISTAQDSTIKIGGIHPLSGAQADAGIPMDNAIQMAIDEINAAGGLLGGIQLEYLSADSRGAANTGQSEAERLIGEGAAALVCCFHSEVAASVAAVAERSQVPLVIDVAAADAILDQGFTFTFRLQPNATAMGTSGANFIQEFSAAVGEPVETVVFMHEGTTEFGRSVAAAFVKRSQEIGLEVLDVIAYDVRSTDLTSEMTQASSMAPDVLAVTGYYTDGLLIARNAEEIGLDVKAIVGIAQGTYDQPQFVRAESGLSECFLDVNYRWDASNPAAETVREDYEDTFRQPMTTNAILAYQSVYIIADAITRAGSADPVAIRDALASTNYSDHVLSYSGAIRFDRTGETVNAAPVLTQVLNGEVVQIWPESGAETEPVYPCTSWGYPR